MVIDDGSLQLRPPTLEDVDAWLAGEDDELARAFEFPRRSTRADVVGAIEAWSEAWRSGGPVRCWAICDAATGAIAGGVELSRLDDGDVNLSYFVFAPWRRRGIATRAAELALAYAATAMGARRAVLDVLDGNAASIAVARRLGAAEVGTRPSHAGGVFRIFRRVLG